MHTAIACVLGGLSVIRTLGRERIPVACVVTPETKGQPSLSRFVRRTVTAPSALTDAEGLLAALLRFGSSLAEPPVLFVDNDDDLLFVSRNRVAPRAAISTAVRSKRLLSHVDRESHDDCEAGRSWTWTRCRSI